MGKSKGSAVKIKRIVGEMLFKFKKCYIVNCIVEGKKKLRVISKQKINPKTLVSDYKLEKVRFARMKARAKKKQQSDKTKLDKSPAESVTKKDSHPAQLDEFASTTQVQPSHDTSTVPTGLKYFSNNCFVSSVLQMLYTISPLRMAVEKFQSEVNWKEEVTCSLGNVFRKMSGVSSTCVKFFVTTLLQTPGFKDFGQIKRRAVTCNQSDAQEFFLQITDVLKDSIFVDRNGVATESLAFQQMYCQSVYQRTTFNNKTSLSATDEMPFIQSVVGDHVPDLYSGMMADNTGETDNSKYKESIKQITRLPSYITIQLKRFSFNKETKKSSKLFQKQDFPIKLDMERFCLPELQDKIQQAREKKIGGSHADDPGSNATAFYQLTAVVSHIGSSLQSGHYVAWAKKNIGHQEVWYKCNDDHVTRVDQTEVLGLAEEDTENGIAYLLLYGPCDDFHPKGNPHQIAANGNKGNSGEKKPAVNKNRKLSRSQSKFQSEPAAEVPYESDDVVNDSEMENTLDDPQFNESEQEFSNCPNLDQRSLLWEMEPLFPITADQLSVWKVGQKTTCSFLFEEHWMTSFPALGTAEWKDGRGLLMRKLTKMNMGRTIDHEKTTKNSEWKCRQCCVFFGSYDGFTLHLKCHHLPSYLMTMEEKQAAVICVDTLQSVEKRDKYFNPAAVLRCQFLLDCYLQKVIDRNFNILKEAEIGRVFHTWAKKRGLRIPEIAQLQSTLLFPELNDAVWDVYRVKNWKFSEGPGSLAESDLQIASDTTFHYINQMKELARSRGKIYTFLLVRADVAVMIREGHSEDAAKFLEEYYTNIIKKPLIIIVGKTSSGYLHSRYHFQSHLENSSYTRNLLETGRYTPFRISSVPFRTESTADYQEALAKQELTEILYVKMCISYVTALKTYSKLQYVNHQKVEGHVLQEMLRKNPNTLDDIMDAVVKNNGEIFKNQDSAKIDSLQIPLCNPSELSADLIKLKRGKKSICPVCGYVHGSKRDQILHKLLHSKTKTLAASSTVDQIFSTAWNFAEENERDLFLQHTERWKSRHQKQKSEYFCYLLALDHKNERDKHQVFRRLTMFLSDMEYRKQNPDMFWFYGGKNSTDEKPSDYHTRGHSGVARTGRNSYTIKTWKFATLQQQLNFEASLLLFAEKAEEYQHDALHFINKRLEYTAFENPLSLETIRLIYSNVNDNKQIFTLDNNIENQETPLYCGNQLDEATFSLHMSGSYKIKTATEKTENKKERGKEKSGIIFPFHCKACSFGFTNY